jgi:hypothetical protein
MPAQNAVRASRQPVGNTAPEGIGNVIAVTAPRGLRTIAVNVRASVAAASLQV